MTLGYLFSRIMKLSHKRGYLDHESYVVQCLALAVLTMGVVKTIGSDDLLAVFFAGNTSLPELILIRFDHVSSSCQVMPLHGMVNSRAILRVNHLIRSSGTFSVVVVSSTLVPGFRGMTLACLI